MKNWTIIIILKTMNTVDILVYTKYKRSSVNIEIDMYYKCYRDNDRVRQTANDYSTNKKYTCTIICILHNVVEKNLNSQRPF